MTKDRFANRENGSITLFVIGPSLSPYINDYGDLFFLSTLVSVVILSPDSHKFIVNLLVNGKFPSSVASQNGLTTIIIYYYQILVYRILRNYWLWCVSQISNALHIFLIVYGLNIYSKLYFVVVSYLSNLSVVLNFNLF